MGAKADAIAAAQALIDAAQALIDAAKAAVVAVIDNDLPTAYAAMATALAMPDDNTSPGTPDTLYIVWNYTGVTLTFQQRTISDLADESPAIPVADNESCTIVAGHRFRVTSEEYGEGSAVAFADDLAVYWDAENNQYNFSLD